MFTTVVDTTGARTRREICLGRSTRRMPFVCRYSVKKSDLLFPLDTSKRTAALKLEIDLLRSSKSCSNSVRVRDSAGNSCCSVGILVFLETTKHPELNKVMKIRKMSVNLLIT